MDDVLQFKDDVLQFISYDIPYNRNVENLLKVATLLDIEKYCVKLISNTVTHSSKIVPLPLKIQNKKELIDILKKLEVRNCFLLQFCHDTTLVLWGFQTDWFFYTDLCYVNMYPNLFVESCELVFSRGDRWYLIQ